MKMGSVFSGFGGLDLGFELAGWEIAWQVEVDGFCNSVLRKNFPHAKRFNDVRGCGRHNLSSVDCIAGGFPCQDISQAGRRCGIIGERSGLWAEFVRVIRELRPRFALVENVSALLIRGIDTVLGDLAESGYDAEWDCLPAASFGAPHIRDRVWILAYPRQEHGRTEGRVNNFCRRPKLLPEGDGRKSSEWSEHRDLITLVPGIHPGSVADWWARQSRMDRSVNGLPRWVVDARNGGLGNAVVVQVAKWIAERIMRLK